jgi:hypothetical protein
MEKAMNAVPTLIAMTILWALLFRQFVRALSDARGPRDALAAYLLFYPACVLLAIAIANGAASAFSSH